LLSEDKFSNICDLVKHLRASKVFVPTSISTDIEEEIEEEIVPTFISTNINEEIEETSKNEKIPRNIIKHPQDKLLAVIGKPAIYVRESYEDLYYLITNRASKDFDHKFLVTGTSGIGKSCFLIYFLVRLLCEYKDVTVIFQPIQSEVFYCFKDLNLSSGSYDDFSIQLQSSKTWYLADGIIFPKLVPAKTVIALSLKGAVKR